MRGTKQRGSGYNRKLEKAKALHLSQWTRPNSLRVLLSTLKMEAACSSETLVTTYQTTTGR
jgi:hypothetical protein